jgi:hypothetical protein
LCFLSFIGIGSLFQTGKHARSGPTHAIHHCKSEEQVDDKYEKDISQIIQILVFWGVSIFSCPKVRY